MAGWEPRNGRIRGGRVEEARWEWRGRPAAVIGLLQVVGWRLRVEGEHGRRGVRPSARRGIPELRDRRTGRLALLDWHLIVLRNVIPLVVFETRGATWLLARGHRARGRLSARRLKDLDGQNCDGLA